LLSFRDGLSQVCGLLPQAQVEAGILNAIAQHGTWPITRILLLRCSAFGARVMPINESAPGEPGALDWCKLEGD
jgi:hypothetical protein